MVMSEYEFCATIIAAGMLLLKITEKILLPFQSSPNHAAHKFTRLRKSVRKFNELIDGLKDFKYKNRKKHRPPARRP